MNSSYDWLKAVESQIRSSERKTSVEFVPVWNETSSSYSDVTWIATLGVLVFCLALADSLPADDLPRWMDWAAAGGVSILVRSVLMIPAVLRWVIPPSVKQSRVADAAERAFLEHQIFNTRARTGVLIYVSELEHAVYVLADKGLTTAVSPQEWTDLGAMLASDFGANTPGTKFIEAIQTLEHRLSKDFPPHPDSPNELPDHVRRT